MTTRQEEAVTVAEMAATRHPTDPEILIRLGGAYFEARRYAEAITTLQRAIDLNPDDARSHQLIGRAYLDDGQVDAAILAFQRAIELDPDYVEPYVSLGVLYSWRLGNYPAALDAFQHALALDPEHPFGLAQLAYTYACMGRLEDAIASLEETTRHQPDNERALENLSMVYLASHGFEDVIVTCRRHIEVDAEVNDPHRMMGYAYSRLGRYEEAIVELERAVTLSPHIYEIRGALSRVLRIAGRDKEADRHYGIAAQQASEADEFGQASFAAACGDADRAMSLLTVAMLKEQVPLGWLRIDPDLHLIRDDPRFRALVEERQAIQESTTTTRQRTARWMRCDTRRSFCASAVTTRRS